MYWPSVQDDVSPSPVARGVVCVAPRLFGRPVLLEMRDLRFDSPSGSLMQPLSALLQPITDKFSQHVQSVAAAFNQSTPTAAGTAPRPSRADGAQEKSSCAR